VGFGGVRQRSHRLNCKMWGCCYCGPRKAKRYRYFIGQLAEREKLARFLTLDPSKVEGDSVRYLRGVYLRGAPVKYIAVLEVHKSGVAHLHVRVDHFIPWDCSKLTAHVGTFWLNYIKNLKAEVKKGMRGKAEQGVYPGRAPFGYKNNSVTRSIDVHKKMAPVIKRVLELYASGEYSLVTLRKAVLTETGLRISRAYLETILKNPFYIGRFVWRSVEYKGTHQPLVSPDLFERVQEAFSGRHKPKYRKHQFAFAGLLRCAHYGCTVTTELQKKRYIYYRCSQGRGKCSLPYMRELDVSDRLGDLLTNIYVPDTIARTSVDSLQTDLQRLEAQRQEQVAALQQQLAAISARMGQLYEDELDGKIDEQFWTREQAE